MWGQQFREALGVLLPASLTISAILRNHLSRHQQLSPMLIGVVHGLTNTGGTMLSMHAALLHEEKECTTQGVALGYPILAVSQRVVPMLTRAPADPYPGVLSVAVAALTYTLMGRHVPAAVQQRTCQFALSGYMLLCAGFPTFRQLT